MLLRDDYFQFRRESARRNATVFHLVFAVISATSKPVSVREGYVIIAMFVHKPYDLVGVVDLQEDRQLFSNGIICVLCTDAVGECCHRGLRSGALCSDICQREQH